MPIIKLNATRSTNVYLRQLSMETVLQNYTVVVTDKQTQGRGQMGTVWEVEPYKNLTFSVFKRLDFWQSYSHFYLNIIASLALIDTLKHFNVPKLSVKWPNDILSADKKICGILIENVLKQSKIVSSIIGIGLNVNQVEFKNLPNATSMQMVTGVSFDLDDVLHTFIANLKIYIETLKLDSYALLKIQYESLLFRKNKASTFKDENGKFFIGIIQGVSSSGELKVLLEDNIIKKFDFKTITLLY